MSTPSSEVQLKDAAEGNNIDSLYTVIQQDTFVLDRIDSIPFVETPLHVAAYAGHVHFALEIMRLKPSYAYKLNQQGLSPIHLAIKRARELNINQQGLDHDQLAIQKRMIMMMRRLVETDKDIVRLKGRERITPLHFATQIGDLELLADFLFACPNSIQDVTVRGETALHIAAKNNHYDALQILVGHLNTNHQKISMEMEKIILNWKDEDGNTVLHISVLHNNIEALQLLVKTKINLKAKNLQESTALNIIENDVRPNTVTKVRMKEILNFTFMDTILLHILRIRREFSMEQRNAFLIGATLIATATFQSSLSPPGGFYGDNNLSMNTTTSQTTTIGKSVMSEADFLTVSIFNTFCLSFATLTIYLLTPITGLAGTILFFPMFSFACICVFNMKLISPTSVTSTFNLMTFLLFHAVYFLRAFYLVYKKLKEHGYTLRRLCCQS